jgi:hypothetical protein
LFLPETSIHSLLAQRVNQEKARRIKLIPCASINKGGEKYVVAKLISKISLKPSLIKSDFLGFPPAHFKK